MGLDITVVWRTLAAIGILGLVVLIVLWNGWFSPVQDIPRSIEIAVLVIPLLFFVRGILHGQRNTFIAVTLLSFPYALMGIWYIYSAQETLYGYLMLLASLFLFFGSLLNVWVMDKRDKQRTEALQDKNVKKGGGG